MPERDKWGADTSVSRPEPVQGVDQMSTVDLGGFVFGPSGLMLPVSQAVVEQRYAPRWSSDEQWGGERRG